MPHTVLSLDLGSKLGWCLGVDNQIQASGVKLLHNPKAHAGDRYLQFQNWLAGWKGVDEIFFERIPRTESIAAGNVYGGLRAILLIFGQLSGKQITSMYAPTVKKIFTDNGRAKKVDMCRACHALGWLGGERGTAIADDEADACAIYYAIMQRRGIDVTFARHQIGHNNPPESITPPRKTLDLGL